MCLVKTEILKTHTYIYIYIYTYIDIKHDKAIKRESKCDLWKSVSPNCLVVNIYLIILFNVLLFSDRSKVPRAVSIN